MPEEKQSLSEFILADYGIPRRFLKIAAEEQQDDEAVVLILENEEPDFYPCEVNLHKQGGQWIFTGVDHYDCGWRPAGAVEDWPDNWPVGAEMGFVTYWGAAPARASQVTVAYRGETKTVPVTLGYFLAVLWGIRGRDFDRNVLPRTVASDGDGTVSPPLVLRYAWEVRVR